MTRRVFQLIDFDRTLFDTGRFFRLVNQEVNTVYPGLGDELEVKVEEAYAHEETFFVFRYLRQKMGDQAFEALVERVVAHEGRETFLMPSIHERLAFADTFSDLRPSWGILTYGDEVDQLMKFRVAGFENAHFLISDTADKGNLIASWRNEDGTYTLPVAFGGQTVDQLVFEDDKLRAFAGLPDEVTKLWITQYEDARDRMKEANLEVIPVSGLAASIRHLKSTD